MAQRLLTTADVADIFQVTPETVARWVRDGLVPALKAPGGGGYRFRQSDIDDFLDVTEGTAS